MVETGEQCGRTALPEPADLTPLDSLLGDPPADRQLPFADEAGGALAQAVRPGPAALAVALWMTAAGDWQAG